MTPREFEDGVPEPEVMPTAGEVWRMLWDLIRYELRDWYERHELKFKVIGGCLGCFVGFGAAAAVMIQIMLLWPGQ